MTLDLGNLGASTRTQPEKTIYLVLQDFGALGRAYRETDPDCADMNSVIDNLIRGEFDQPLQVVAFNVSEGWAKDVSASIAAQVRTRLIDCKKLDQRDLE